MRLVIQRVKKAIVMVNNESVGKIERGLLVFLGVGREDNKEIADCYINKLLKLRIFEDKDGKSNLSLQDVKGEILVVSQFTLYAECRKGNRPDFTKAAGADKANEIYEYFLDSIKARFGKVQSGVFGASMEVSILNEGPFTIVLDESFLT